MPPIASPITEPVTMFQNIQVPPQPGVASATNPTGRRASAPQSGPRRYQRSGHVVVPTRKPIRSRAVYQPQTAMLPRIPSTLNLYGIGPWTRRGSQARTRPATTQTGTYGTGRYY